jgi:hypothetical protein
MKKLFGGSRYANVTATLAFIVALGGTSYAAGALPINSIGSAQIKPNGVTSSDIASNAVNSAKVKDKSLKAKDFASGQLPKGPAGPAGPAGLAGPTGATGATGAAGAAGAAGTARAYAHVNADGTLDAANSKGVTSSVLGTDPGRYCFDLPFTPQNIVTSAERVVGGINGAFAEPAITATIAFVCPAGSQEAGVLMFNNAGTLVNNSFFIMFN